MNPSSNSAAASAAPPGELVDNGKGRIFPCDGCGSDLKFHIPKQNLRCEHCGFERAINIPAGAEVAEQDYDSTLERLSHTEAPPIAEQVEVRCEGCGGNVVFTGALTSTECPYCASPIQRENIHTGEVRIKVDGMLSFRVEHDIAREKLAQWVRSRWFAPTEFRRRGIDGKFNGVYLPYWTFDAYTANWYQGEMGRYYEVEVRDSNNQVTKERRIEWYPASGSFHREFDDMLVPATRGLLQQRLLDLEPWPLQSCVPFTQEMLAGFFARTYELDLEPAHSQARQRMDAEIEQQVKREIGGDEQRVHQIESNYSNVTFKNLLLPVWMLAYRYHDKAYQVFINATTGEVQGDRPWSWLKISLTVLTVLLLAVALFVMSRK